MHFVPNNLQLRLDTLPDGRRKASVQHRVLAGTTELIIAELLSFGDPRQRVIGIETERIPITLSVISESHSRSLSAVGSDGNVIVTHLSWGLSLLATFDRRAPSRVRVADLHCSHNLAGPYGHDPGQAPELLPPPTLEG